MINYALLIFIFCLSLVISFLLTPILRDLAVKKGLVSQPGRRRVHTKPIPYLGGVAIYFSFVIGVLIIFYTNQQFRMDYSKQLQGLLGGGALIMILGLWDDIKNLRPLTKILGQTIVALLLYSWGFRIEVLTNPLVGGEMYVPLPLSILITVAWVVGLINAMNLADGLDGLAAGITVIVSVSLLFIALFLNSYITVFLLAALAASTLGFLRYNFYPAKIFMGDSGSMFLGLVLALTALIGFQYKSATAAVLLIPITALALPIYDIFMAVVRRLLKRGSIFKADKKHLHHRLLDIGLKQRQIVLFLYVVTAYLGVFAFLFVLIPGKYALVLLILLGLGLFMGIRIISFIEIKTRLIHRLELEKKRK